MYFRPLCSPHQALFLGNIATMFSQQLLDRQLSSRGCSSSGRSAEARPSYKDTQRRQDAATRHSRSACRAALLEEVLRTAEPAAEEGEEEGEWEVEYLSGGGDWEEDWAEDDERAKNKRTGKSLPVDMRCFDTARIHVRGGEGGRGIVSFRREKFVPKGGPSGGNGGSGGNVWAVGDPSLNSLQPFRRYVHFRAAGGSTGGTSKSQGACGEDAIVKVPLGTVLRRRDAEEGEPAVAEILRPGQRALLASGGRGGRGNASFKSARDNAPTLAELGAKGEETWLDLELKLVADVGIVGVPNAGKSTLLSVVSAAKPKVADYPFTTLVPNLGVCEQDFRTVVFADIPGLLEGAHSGRGLGHEFLRHCQRSRVLVHVIDGTSPDPLGDYHAIRNELELFNEDLARKPEVVAYNKVDVPDSGDYWEDVRESLLAAGLGEDKFVAISAVTGEGVTALIRKVHTVLDSLPALDPYTETVEAFNTETAPTHALGGAMIDDYSITRDKGRAKTWRVEGAALERFASMTDWNYYEAVARFQKVLDATGINKALREKGVQEGDTVVVGELELAWSDDQTEGALYGTWLADMKSKGTPIMGISRWPNS